MADTDSIKKLLRSVLQSSKEGVSLSTLQSDYRSLCGDSIPLKKLGYSRLEDYLRSIPSVVHLESHMGELRCFAVVCQKTAHIAELVAKQKSSKKSGRSHIICIIRLLKLLNSLNASTLSTGRYVAPFENVQVNSGKGLKQMLNIIFVFYCISQKQRKKHVASSVSFRKAPRTSLDKQQVVLQTSQCIYYPVFKNIPEVYQKLNVSLYYHFGSYNVELVRRRMSKLLEKYYSGVWMSKLSELYSNIFSENLHPHALIDIKKWTDICMVEKPSITHQSDRLIYPPLPPKPSPRPLTPPTSLNATSSPAEVCERIKEILHRCSHGLWASALPKLYVDTYKMPFPEHILDNLSLLLNICIVEYPLSHDKTKAILYSSPTNKKKEKQCTDQTLPFGLEVSAPVLPPCLVGPSVQYSSVLITDVKSSNAVTIRYVGEKYSDAQEAMEETMSSFYKQRFAQFALCKAVVGQLVAVSEEDGDEVTRAQVVEIISEDKVKVYYLDYGFLVETSRVNMLELRQDFLSLPFQATCVSLADLQAFCSHPSVLSSLNKLVGKILLMETIEPRQENKASVVVLYDTSQEDDININSTCLKALQDHSMNNPLTVKATCQNVCVTNVDPEGIIYCQLPCRGRARLCQLLEETEAIFSSQHKKSTFLVSRPFSGKVCLAQYKGKWARVEITVTYASKVVEILFIDLGVPMTADVTDLREFPPALLPDFIIIPPQITRCRLAELRVPGGRWSPRAVLLVKKAVLGAEDCKLMISELEQHKGNLLVYVYLFIGTQSLELDKSVNHQLAQSESWNKAITQKDAFDHTTSNPAVSVTNEPSFGAGVSSSLKVTSTPETTLPLLKLPQPPTHLSFLFQPDQFMDVFVTLVHDPGHFVLQPWLDMHKLAILMGDMILYYTRKWTGSSTICVQKGEVYAAKVGKKWCRVQVKEICDSDSVCVYELDYGKTKVVHRSVFQPLVTDFRQLPFQAVVAQLAGSEGVTRRQWSDEASLLFRKHVEHRALVAKVERVLDVKGHLWECRLLAYLVDTSMEDTDLWIHSLMADVCDEPSTA
uniref:Tudor domain containing 7 a n=1 Tax=Tetraodon nigroviridis TaxID=99883 RepID=H3DL34_TETNG